MGLDATAPYPPVCDQRVWKVKKLPGLGLKQERTRVCKVLKLKGRGGWQERKSLESVENKKMGRKEIEVKKIASGSARGQALKIVLGVAG
jgi:hypothetical protein